MTRKHSKKKSSNTTTNNNTKNRNNAKHTKRETRTQDTELSSSISSTSATTTTTTTPTTALVVLAMAIIISSFSSFLSFDSDENKLGKDTSSLTTTTTATDPWVDIIPNVIPPKTCMDIMKRSEKIGYRLFDDSIDKGEPDNLDQQAQEIYIYYDKQVIEPTLYELVQPHLFKITKAIQNRGKRLQQQSSPTNKFVNGTSFTDPTIEWMFLRKYYPLGRYSKRNSLKVHTDSNMHSITLALNDNYIGGGLFVVRPPPDGIMEENNHGNNKKSNDTTTQKNKREEEMNNFFLPLPKIPAEYSGYKWLHDESSNLGLAQGQNSSHIFFPDLKQGSAALINFTVPHGVAPLSEESPIPRYALIVFYNIDSYHEEIKPLIQKQLLQRRQ